MTEVSAIAGLEIREGKLEEFKRLAALVLCGLAFALRPLT